MKSMKPFLLSLFSGFAAFTFTTLVFSGIGFAADSALDPLTNPAALELIFKALGGIPGSSALAIAAIATQVVMYALRSELGEKTGLYRFLIVAFLNMGLGFLGQLIAGVEWKVALLSPTVLTALSVFLHQFGKQVVKVPDDQSVASLGGKY